MGGELYKAMIIRLKAGFSTIRREGGEWKLKKERKMPLNLESYEQ